MNTRRFDALIDGLADLDARDFSYKFVVSSFDRENGVGTCCCAVGWFPKFFPEHWEWHEDWSIGKKNGGPAGFKYSDIAEFLDIPVEHVRGLFFNFSGGEYALPIPSPDAEELTPTDMCRVLNDYKNWAMSQ